MRVDLANFASRRSLKQLSNDPRWLIIKTTACQIHVVVQNTPILNHSPIICGQAIVEREMLWLDLDGGIVREAAKKVFFFSGWTTKAFIPPPPRA